MLRRAETFCTAFADILRLGKGVSSKGRLIITIMKGSIPVEENKLIEKVYRMKNRQIAQMRERADAYEEMNRILAAYIVALIGDKGFTRIPRDVIRSLLDKYRAEAILSEDDYCIFITPASGNADGNGKK